jgi:altronate dehydratase small subunit
MGDRKAVLLHEKDNVANLTEDAEEGDTVVLVGGTGTGQRLKVSEKIPFGFKVAVRDIVKGENILKYGHPMGVASADIPAGSLVHIHNVEGARGRGDRQEIER